jgi:transposase
MGILRGFQAKCWRLPDTYELPLSVCYSERDFALRGDKIIGGWLWVCARRMEQGRLHWPTSEEGRVQLTREEFALLIGGIDLTATTKRKWYRRPVTETADISRKPA